MKQNLFLLAIFLSTLFPITLIAQQTVTFNPVSRTVGMTKKGGEYTQQVYNDERSQFYVGYNALTDTYGVGYLEFDLSAIPNKSTINKVVLKLKSVSGGDPNFNGSINIFRCSKYGNNNESTWIDLNANPSLLLNSTFSKTDLSMSLSSESLTRIVQNGVGSPLYLSINHYFGNKIIRFAANILDLALEVTYTDNGNGDTTTEPQRPQPIPLPGIVFAGENIKFGYTGAYYFEIKDCNYDHTLFDLVEKSLRYIILRPKNVSTSVRTSVSVTVEDRELYFWGNKYKCTYDFPIYERPIIEPVTKFIGQGGEMLYTLKNAWVGSKPVSFKWESLRYMNFLSNAGEFGYFRANSTGGGYAKVKVTVTYEKSSYSFENETVWVGPPIASRPPYMEEDAFILTNNTNMVEVSSYIQGAQNYNWTFVKGRDKCVRFDGFQNADRNFFWPAKPTGSDIYNEYIFDVEGVNSCGKVTNRIRFIYPKYANGGFSLRSALIENTDQPEIKSVKIYNLSGVLVYSNNAVNGSFDIKSTVLTDGIYIIEKFDGQNRTSEKVMLKR